jgi:2,3-diketo-5-methylthio-1-phosphopentane phosphatase
MAEQIKTIKQNRLNISVYSDFDGTIMKKDIGDELFKVNGEFEPWHSMLKARELDIKDYWRTVCSKLPKNIDKKFIREFVLEYDYDPYFKVLADFCRNNGISISVISDGFKDYIDPILEKMEVLDSVRTLANKLEYKEDSSIMPKYYGASESCECFCASCKRNSILVNTPPDDIIVYIGDGYSDFCGAKHADIIFAKSALSAYCNEHRIPHYNYSNFFDVYRIFSNLVANKKIKQRRQAFLLRKQAFENE